VAFQNDFQAEARGEERPGSGDVIFFVAAALVPISSAVPDSAHLGDE
jgi:hypothetical protein